MIHFDIDQRYLDEAEVGTAISRREGVLISAAVHALVLFAVSFLPQLTFLQEMLPEREPRVAEREPPEVTPLEEEPRFVFVQPRVELPTPEPPPPVAELSDRDRVARDPEVAALPDDALPFSLGDSAERILPPEEEAGAGEEALVPAPEPESTLASRDPLGNSGFEFAPEPAAPAGPDGGLLADALRNLERYVQGQTFDNPRGGADDTGAAIQFDTRGVDFGPWLNRFVAEVYNNWFVPRAAFGVRDRVILQFNIWKNGRITDIRVASPAAIGALTRAAVDAIAMSSPVPPLPEEYPVEPALFTVTFYYNQSQR